MKITADSNILLRGIVRDDLHQAAIARTALDAAQLIVISTACLCEICWVLRRYKHSPQTIATTVRALLNSDNAVTDRQAADAGLSMLDAGGDFADGVIAHEGRSLGADKFLSFDKNAVSLLQQQGEAAELLA